jgi:hypothetical protein
MRKYLLVAVLTFLLIFGCTSETKPMTPETNASITQKAALGPDYCFYNSTAETLTCGRPLMLEKLGKMYDVNDTASINFCGLAALEDTTTNDSYLIYISGGKDQLFQLNNETSDEAVANQVGGAGCNTTTQP